MGLRLADRVSQQALAEFSGRASEIAALSEFFSDGPLVFYVHGVAGIGKSTLLEIFGQHARARGASVVRIDCRAVEPTQRGFLGELSEALGESLETREQAAERLAGLGERVIIALDTYEVLRLLDTWVRQSFVASLPDNARVVIASRNPPSAAWRTAPGWTPFFRSIKLEPLSEQDALEYLARAGLGDETAQRINRVVRGHPLALGMAASLAQSKPERSLPSADLHQVVDDLAREYLASVPDADTRVLLEATSVVRCITEPLLQALLPGIAPRDAIERLRELPFVERGRDGLFIHDAVRSAIAASFAARDPDSHRQYRLSAWSYLRDKLARAASGELWRLTADSFFLLENPVLREGFFPSGPQPLAVEPATPEDADAIRAIVEMHAPAELLMHDVWWRHHQRGFSVVKDGDGVVRGYYVMVAGAELHDDVAAVDPIAAEWRRDSAGRGDAAALFCRRLLDRGAGERPCAAQAACWVDIKRTYLDMRNTLRWVYMTLRDPQPFAAIAIRLGFRPTAVPTISIADDVLHSFVLDMGPGGVDGWLSEMVGVDVAAGASVAVPATLLDVPAQELALPSGRVALTSLEFGVMRHLHERPGQAVSRYDLLEAVWGHRNPNSSNVVDVVVRSLRKKLGARARQLETVRGTGYRFRS